MSRRHQVLAQIASELEPLADRRVVRVAIDGVDGAGKTTFADELAASVGVPVVRASVDSFHNPRATRYARGEDSPQGFFEDSFNYGLLKEYLLDPLSPGGTNRYRVAAFDHRLDTRVDAPIHVAPVPSVLILDGIFLHRPDVRGYWDYSVFLVVSRTESLRRCIERDGAEGITPDPNDPVHRRYVLGQELYLRQCDPVSLATRVVNNEVLDSPYIAV